jgi:hypothetical protein
LDKVQQIPSAVTLIDGFLKDLQDIGSLFGASGSATSQKNTTSVMIYAAQNNNSTWTTDRDCTLVGVLAVAGSTNWALTLDSSTYTTNWATTGHGKVGVLLGIYTSGFPVVIHQRVFLPKGTKLFFSNNSASNAGVLLTIEVD